MSIPAPIKGKGATISNPASATAQNLIPAAVRGVPEESRESLAQFVTSIYNPEALSADELKAIYDAVAYKGFNREDVLKQMHLIGDKRIIIELIIATALRGPQAAGKIRFSNGRTPSDMGIPASGGKGVKTLTLNKISAATADLAAFYLKKLDVPKRSSFDLPGWLQFPTAGSIKMPFNYREQHREFSRRFSTLIGGVFQEQIYMQMEHNSYLDPNLHLFE
jgi:hypothetical protein